MRKMTTLGAFVAATVLSSTAYAAPPPPDCTLSGVNIGCSGTSNNDKQDGANIVSGLFASGTFNSLILLNQTAIDYVLTNYKATFAGTPGLFETFIRYTRNANVFTLTGVRFGTLANSSETVNIGNGPSVTVTGGPVSVPGPIAGAGLPLLVGFAGYAAWRRRKTRATA